MACCHYDPKGTSRVFSWFARGYRRRYVKKGLEKTQKHLLAGLVKAGFADATILEIGCGVGYLHQSLIRSGAASAIGIDLSERMLDEARALAAQQRLTDRTQYLLGDFNRIHAQVPPVDLTLLDKVICCYPDAKGLIKHSLAKTRRVYALTYPKANLLNRIGVALLGAAMWALRIDFRNFIHDPAEVEHWITEQGFRKHYEHNGPLWLTQVYIL